MDLWTELHTRALNFIDDDTNYLYNFAQRIPKYTRKDCKCKDHWRIIFGQNPPTYGDNYFSWTVKVHNLINKKLGKAIITEKEARKLYEK